MNINPSGKSRFRIALSKCACVASVSILLTLFSSAIASTEPTAQEILKVTQRAYDALTSYSDQSTAESDTMGQHSDVSYTTQLLRPNFYKIEWTGSSPSGPVKGICRPDGTSSLVTIASANSADAMQPMKSSDLQSSLAAITMATGVPIGSDIPGIFLNQKNSLTALVSPAPQVKTTINKQADESIGQTECYVISVVTDLSAKSSTGQTIYVQATSRLSIGKKDFLIRRWKIDQGSPGMAFISTITHQDVSANPHFSPTDFAH